MALTSTPEVKVIPVAVSVKMPTESTSAVIEPVPVSETATKLSPSEIALGIAAEPPPIRLQVGVESVSTHAEASDS